MKKFLAGVMAFCLLALNVAPVLAAVNILDVAQNYWAKKEIYNVVENGIMKTSADKFNPEDGMTRAGFVTDLLKVLSNDNCDVKIKNQFTDLNEENTHFSDILRSQQLGLVYGYPDGTFMPNRVMTRSEAQSVISHITKERVSDTSVLNQFKDVKTIPAWAKQVYAKTIFYGIYVNYPDSRELRPNDELTRAEAAVLLSRLRDKLSLVKKEYVGPEAEKLLATEHLALHKKAPSNIVKITNKRSIITKDNVLLVSFDQKFKQKLSYAGNEVYFNTPQDINTVEGTLLIPAGSKFKGQILQIKDPKWFNKNGRVYVQLTEVAMPSGQKVALNAKPFTKNYELKEGPWMTTGKVALWTLGLGAIGTGAGIGFAFIPDPAKIGNAFAIGTPIGLSVGLVTGLVSPGLKYNAKKGEKVYVILLDDASITKTQSL